MDNPLKRPVGELLDAKAGKKVQIIIFFLALSSWVYLYLTKDGTMTMGNGFLSIFLLVWFFSNLFTLLLIIRYIFKFIGKRKLTAVIVMVLSILLAWFYLQAR